MIAKSCIKVATSLSPTYAATPVVTKLATSSLHRVTLIPGWSLSCSH
ncbi:unnamed protein product [Thelazia callipaeda]|uniref:Uncharacterized protein n=1 Tax=Thelazia callipaeda TaxID=103827 RepID=A0A158RD66_THECL|nr:unnamed protein product [Thelazia callipaeda]